MLLSKPLPQDENREAIQAGSTLSGLLNVEITTAGYVAVTLPTGTACKSVVAKARSGGTWLLALASSPTTWLTVTGALSLALVADAGDVLFYAKGTVADTLEILLVD